MEFKTLCAWMEDLNSNYYKNPKTKIYDDFLTYAQSEKGMLTKSNAIDFYNRVKDKNQKKYKILEVGVGNGAFANGFLTQIKELDSQNSTNILSKISYTLADFSKPVLEKARKFNEKFENYCALSTFTFDASLQTCTNCGELSDKNQNLGTYDLIRCNELFSDVPADLFVHSDEVVYEVYLDDKMSAQLKSTDDLDELELKLLYSLPQNYFIPINRIAANTISFLTNHLSPSGYMDIFDYGFYYERDFVIPPDMWNMSIVREYNTQWTVDLNFIYLASTLSALEKSATVESQKEFVQKISGKRLAPAQEGSLDYEKAQDDLEEDDFFYHMRIRNLQNTI